MGISRGSDISRNGPHTRVIKSQDQHPPRPYHCGVSRWNPEGRFRGWGNFPIAALLRGLPPPTDFTCTHQTSATKSASPAPVTSAYGIGNGTGNGDMHLGILPTRKPGLDPNVVGDPPTPQHMAPLSMAPLLASLGLGSPHSKSSRCALPAGKHLAPSGSALLSRLSFFLSLVHFTPRPGTDETELWASLRSWGLSVCVLSPSLNQLPLSTPHLSLSRRPLRPCHDVR